VNATSGDLPSNYLSGDAPYTGELLVTWADVDWRYRDGVERYLGEVLQPIVGRRFPDVASVEVNLPG
jgi:hypothetical protein